MKREIVYRAISLAVRKLNCMGSGVDEKTSESIGILVVLLFGFALFYFGTDGFTAYTAETARVNQLKEDQPKFPDVTLEDSNRTNLSIF